MFSKKYPIEIRTNGLSLTESQQPTSLLKNRKFSRSKESINSDDSDIFKDVVGTPPKHSPVSETAPDRNVFYLFARADREKEDIYKVLTDAHYFLTDTVLDVARREDAITEGNRWIILTIVIFLKDHQILNQISDFTIILKCIMSVST